jgi:7,8-dihydropterin-6-yl-methyl-4-(beta-D-ribofuranosyl)aminobenzene 5'-phosphate synthase
MTVLDNFGETENVAITILVDNQADLLVKSSETVIFYTKKPLLAEHGFAALVELQDQGIHILWDAGISKIALMENLRRMEIDPETIDMVVLSHGHMDHTGALVEIVRLAAGRPEARKWSPETTVDEIREWADGYRVPLITHPAAFRERWVVRRDGSKMGPWLSPSRAELEAAGAQVILTEGPYQLAAGCAITGEIPRRSFERAGTSPNILFRDGDQFLQDYIEDDQAIVINVKGRGLVVLAGCAHSGIVNTVNYARTLSQVDKVWAILGGFHLAPAKDAEIELTIEAIEQLAPSLVVPTHCTGHEAIGRFARRMPEQYVRGLVGTKFLF